MNQKLEHVRKPQDEVMWQCCQVQKVLDELLGCLIVFHQVVGEFCSILEEALNEQGTEKGS